MANPVPNPNFNSNPPSKPFNGVNGIELLDPNDTLKKTAKDPPSWAALRCWST